MIVGPQQFIATADMAALVEWTGLAPAMSVEDLTGLGVVIDRDFTGTGALGSDQVAARWFAAESFGYESGVRVWVIDDECVLIEAQFPIDDDGNPTIAGDLAGFGAADGALDTFLGRVRIPRAEHVYASRGLTISVNPETDMVLSIYGYQATTFRDYEQRIRPPVGPVQLRPRADECGAAE